MWGARGIAFPWEEIKEMVSTGLGSQNGIPGGRTCISRGGNAPELFGRLIISIELVRRRQSSMLGGQKV